MMETVADKLDLAIRNLKEHLEAMQDIQRKLAKGAIEPDEALRIWEQKVRYQQFLFRTDKAYITREQVYHRKKTAGSKA